MPRMKAVQISKPGGNFELVERNIPDPGRAQVRIKIEACGICHSDVLVKEGLFPGIQYPRVPGHEIAGRIDAAGADVTNWKPGQRVGVGWHGGHCFTCEFCRRGDFILCRNEKITAIHFDGGYADYVVVPAEAVAAIPDDLPAAEAAPLMCAGITVFNSLRNAGARSGDLVAVLGIGGLGHLGIQYARQMGFRTVAIGRGQDKDPLARKLGASVYIDGGTENPVEALQKLGGAHVILATAPDSKSISSLVDGLAPGGKLLVIGVSPEPLTISPLQLISGRKAIQGWPSGTAKDSEETLAFSTQTGVRPMIERYPLEKAAEAYEQMMSGRARFRAVLTM
ncbi:MAG: alcohol dehydrogenase [Acidobacteria bacterium]|jgi:2-desacetyl-2-hydroxyethyl bacteriochlorophyllide A dehydrogenase|nr:MAG: alcohol dehydrogenase [Acidobacteriota bacterium]